MHKKIKKTLVIGVALISVCICGNYALANNSSKDYQLEFAGNIEIYDMSKNNTAKIVEGDYKFMPPPKSPYPKKPWPPVFW